KSSEPGGFPPPNQRYTIPPVAQANGVAVKRLAAIADLQARLSCINPLLNDAPYETRLEDRRRRSTYLER
ncbi:MAG: hypothetical protein KDB01_27440, partial [Planctomycetaceae bacterium]|nr:hypothetical protein [Planctomycetaceae bacterium]